MKPKDSLGTEDTTQPKPQALSAAARQLKFHSSVAEHISHFCVTLPTYPRGPKDIPNP